MGCRPIPGASGDPEAPTGPAQRATSAAHDQRTVLVQLQWPVICRVAEGVAVGASFPGERSEPDRAYPDLDRPSYRLASPLRRGRISRLPDGRVDTLLQEYRHQ